MTHPRWTTLVTLASVLLVLGGCGSDEKGKTGANTGGLPDGSGGIIGSDITTTTDTDTGATTDTGGTAEDTVASQWKKCENDGDWGCPCKNGDDCNSGYCVEGDEGFMCSKTCIDSCPPSWQCKQASTTDAVYICIPQYVTLCRPCGAHTDCGSQGQQVGQAKCVPMDLGGGFTNGSFCGAYCDDETACPSGFSCKPVGLPGEATVSQCLPDNNECLCSAQETKLALSTACSRVNEFGTCKGARKCSPEGLTLCDAPVPSVEVCDGEDNDCDGLTDEDDAVGCKVYFPDNDGDGAGIGEGKCLCANPGPGYASTGGDCNDIAKSINPGAKEICNDIDDNCNSTTDEAGASGCTIYYKDKDGDSFGDPDDAACMCPSKKTADLIAQAGDCDDTTDKVKPGATETCNGIDDNCNSKTDEEDAEGCKLFYIDLDKDQYGPSDKSKCLCKADAIYTASKPGDCNDNDKTIAPAQLETCNNVDDDCNGNTDDGDAPKSCPKVPGVEPACNAGTCGISKCPKGYFDVDGNFANGCECQADNNFGVGGGTCQAAVDTGSLGDGGSKVIVSGNVMPGEDGDWYKFKAVDGPDVNNCDSFNVRVRFLKNPGATYQLDLYRGSCAGKSQMCTNETEVGWTTAFGGKPPYGVFTAKGVSKGDKVKSPNPLPGGECKCSSANHSKGPGAPGMNFCSNNTSFFWVKVHVAKGKKPACVSYQVEIYNGPS